MGTVQLTERFERALTRAWQLHRDQIRKGSGTPYIAHLLSVTALVLEHGGDEDAAIGALLHDAAEDQGGRATLLSIQEDFGPEVAEIVQGCSDTLTTPKPPWRARKEAYLQQLPTASSQVQLVSLADKVHNARSILEHLQTDGESVWDRFKGGKDGTLWYYQQLVQIFDRLPQTQLTTKFKNIVAEIIRLAR